MGCDQIRLCYYQVTMVMIEFVSAFLLLNEAMFDNQLAFRLDLLDVRLASLGTEEGLLAAPVVLASPSCHLGQCLSVAHSCQLFT